jgi:hypothetical protein
MTTAISPNQIVEALELDGELLPTGLDAAVKETHFRREYPNLAAAIQSHGEAKKPRKAPWNAGLTLVTAYCGAKYWAKDGRFVRYAN